MNTRRRSQMVAGNTATCIGREGGYSLLASLCIHVAVFALLGIMVLNDVPAPQEFVNVEFVTATQQMRRLRRNMLKPRSQTVNDAEPPTKVRDATRPLINRVVISSQVAMEMVPVLQYEPVEMKLPEVYPRKAFMKTPLTVPRVMKSMPVTRSPRPDMFETCNQLPKSSTPYTSVAASVHKVSDSMILQDFLKMVSRKIEQSKRYPKWAMHLSLEGRVVIRFTILQDGTLDEEIQLVSSSGTRILDNAAVTAVRDAAPFPALPRALKREWLQIELPMDFRLRES